MSKASVASGQIISLPKGGGAIQGIGEKFSPDLHTGTGNFTIPIALPPGRNGFRPQLSLVYSTGNGNGPFGMGWSLSLPGISRKTSKGIPIYDDSKDTFILSGVEDLVAIDGASSYRPRSDTLFARIIHRRNLVDNYWEVGSKDGLVSLYGTVGAAGEDTAAISNPSDRRRVFAWKITRTTDPFGNLIEYIYGRDANQTDGPHIWDQVYLTEIRYIDHGSRDAPQFLATVKLEYEQRPDPFSEYRAGFEIRTVKRCARIKIATHADTEIPVRTYHFCYLDQPCVFNQQDLDSESLPHNRASLLRHAHVEGHKGSSSESLPPLEFAYTRFEPEARRFVPITGPDLPAASLANPNFELVDLIGNGLPDVLEMDNVVRYWRNLGGGQLDLPRRMQSAPSGMRIADKGVQIIDANGDGRADLLVTTDNISGYFPLRFGGFWDRRSFQRYRQAPSFDLEDPEVRLVDLNGDGVTDAVRAGNRFEYFFNDPNLGWNSTKQQERRGLKEFPNINFSDTHVKWADMSGDGMQDIAVVYDGNVEYWPSLGYGNWGKRVSMRNSPRFPFGYDPKRILVGDVDGDGLADIVYVDDTRVILWINQSGNSWSNPIEIHGTPPVSDVDAIRLADMFGSGVGGVLWTTDVRRPSQANIFFLDFTGGTKPYLINEMNNKMGAVTRVGYASSTQFYLEDEKRSETRWKTPLPFPVQVVARVESIDEISGGKLTTEYHYHHGYWDGAEREFRGFGRVDHCDTEVFADYHKAGLHPSDRGFESVSDRSFSPPTETRTWFHQGPIGDEFGEWAETDFSNEFWVGDPQVLSRPEEMEDFLRNLPRRAKRDALRALRGEVLRTELYALDGTDRQDRPYTVTEHLHGLREETPPSSSDLERQRIFFPHALAERTTQWERGSDPMTRFTFTGDYDQYGQPRSNISIAVPRRRDFRSPTATGEPYLATQTLTAFAQRDDDDRYIVDRVARASTFEILNDGDDPISLFALRDAIEQESTERRLIAQMHNFYDGAAFKGLPSGQLGDQGALVRSESLVLTEEILHEAYKSGTGVIAPPEDPPYMASSGTPVWTTDYPQAFRDLLPVNQSTDPDRPDLTITPTGFGFATGDGSASFARGYYAATEQRRYDFHDNPEGIGRGLTTVIRDPLRRETVIAYDSFELLPTRVTDAALLTTEAAYDYRVMQPQLITDFNLNRTAFTYTPLGQLESIAVMGKASEGVGDTLNPGTRLIYDFSAFADRGQPISVRTIRRSHHDIEADVTPANRNETIEVIEYSDGFGRLLQKRAQAEDDRFGDPLFGGRVLPADRQSPDKDAEDIAGHHRAIQDPPNVVVTGHQVYDNKGRVVEKFEPFFSVDWNYALPADNERGQKIIFFYDPRGNVIRTVNPDGSEQRVIHGVPGRISAPVLFNPDLFEPTPWETYTYDANDNAGRTHPATSANYNSHWNTPSSSVVDALGRLVKSVERNGADPANDWFTTTSTYDIRGNLLITTDPLSRVVYRGVYDLAQRQLRVEQLDAGVRRIVADAAGNIIEQRDSKGALVLRSFDKINRPIRFRARDDFNQPLTLREHLIYGDSSDSGLAFTQAQNANLLGKMFRHYDESGLLTFLAYDFKGNILEKSRRTISDMALLSVFSPQPPNWEVKAFRVDWQPPDGVVLDDYASSLLDAALYETSTSYDALNRIKVMRYPQDVTGARKELRPRYNRAGALESVAIDGTVYVERIAYNAKGQRTLITFGNNVITRYAYDPQTFRLARMRTERYVITAQLTYHPSGPVFQDFGYEYDLAGNMLKQQDRTPSSGLPNQPDQLDRDFAYDPIYRLLSATGRECATPPFDDLWDDAPKCQDVTLTRSYEEQYSYDKVGNMSRLRHIADSATFNRDFALVANSNRLAEVTVGATSYNYEYDDNGNLIGETTSRHFEWDHIDRMRVFRTQTADAEPSVYAQYLYDASGQRVKKLIRKQGGHVETTVYVDGIFEHHRLVELNATQENNSLHVMDNEKRIALIRVGSAFSGDITPAVKYHVGDHLQSSNVVLDDSGALINREEYTPYGETSFGSFAKKRYRFTSKERDEESGLYYHGARYYAPWLARWFSIDPLIIQKPDGKRLNSYFYANLNPILFNDPSGMDIEISKDSQISAERFVEMIKGYEAIPKNLRDAVEVSKSNPKAIHIGDVKTGTVPEWFRAAITASDRNEWIITTGKVQNRTTKGGVMTGEVQPDISNVTPGFRETASVGGKWVPAHLNMDAMGIVLPTEEMVAGLAAQKPPIKTDTTTPRLPGKGSGLVVVGNRAAALDETGVTRPLTQAEIVNIFFHELALHAGRISAGMDAKHNNADVESWKKELDIAVPQIAPKPIKDVTPVSKPQPDNVKPAPKPANRPPR